MSGQIKKWVFIGGAPRSGTSLLQAIFNQHTMCSSPPESHILETFEYAAVKKAREALNNKSILVQLLKEDKWIHRLGINAEDIVEKLPENASGLDLFRLYMEEYVSGSGKEVLVEGAPLNIWYLKKLHIDFPGSYILHIVRDPRDVILSTEKATYNKPFDFPAEEIASQFMESYLQGPKFGQQLYGSRYIKMYYEDLITRPEATIRSMCERLGIDFQPAMLEFQKSSERVAAKEEDWKANLSKPFIKDNFDKWKSQMDKAILLRTEYICRDFFELEKEHYSLSGSNGMSKIHLLPLYIKKIKSGLRNVISGRKDPDSLDNFPPHERMRAAGMLNQD